MVVNNNSNLVKTFNALMASVSDGIGSSLAQMGSFRPDLKIGFELQPEPLGEFKKLLHRVNDLFGPIRLDEKLARGLVDEKSAEEIRDLLCNLPFTSLAREITQESLSRLKGIFSAPDVKGRYQGLSFDISQLGGILQVISDNAGILRGSLEQLRFLLPEPENL
jgi:hypothetical protein